jgi:anti-sigma regulatory factor (Ser/Thr protein kinase)
LHVIDEGPGFERAPMLPRDLLSESGRGLYIVSELTDEFSVARGPNGGSHARAVLGS